MTVKEFDKISAGIYTFINLDTGDVYDDDFLLDPMSDRVEVVVVYADGKDKFTVYFEEV